MRAFRRTKLSLYVNAVMRKLMSDKAAESFNQEGRIDENGIILKHSWAKLRLIDVVKGTNKFVS